LSSVSLTNEAASSARNHSSFRWPRSGRRDLVCRTSRRWTSTGARTLTSAARLFRYVNLPKTFLRALPLTPASSQASCSATLCDFRPRTGHPLGMVHLAVSRVVIRVSTPLVPCLQQIAPHLSRSLPIEQRLGKISEPCEYIAVHENEVERERTRASVRLFCFSFASSRAEILSRSVAMS